MISRLGELTDLPAYLHISSYATLAIISLINRSNACNCRTYSRSGLHTCVASSTHIMQKSQNLHVLLQNLQKPPFRCETFKLYNDSYSRQV